MEIYKEITSSTKGTIVSNYPFYVHSFKEFAIYLNLDNIGDVWLVMSAPIASRGQSTATAVKCAL